MTALVVRITGEVPQLEADKGRGGGMSFLQRLGLVRGPAKTAVLGEDPE